MRYATICLDELLEYDDDYEEEVWREWITLAQSTAAGEPQSEGTHSPT
jgi:hypothetical protein